MGTGVLVQRCHLCDASRDPCKCAFVGDSGKKGLERHTQVRKRNKGDVACHAKGSGVEQGATETVGE